MTCPYFYICIHIYKYVIHAIVTKWSSQHHFNYLVGTGMQFQIINPEKRRACYEKPSNVKRNSACESLLEQAYFFSFLKKYYDIETDRSRSE